MDGATGLADDKKLIRRLKAATHWRTSWKLVGN